MKLNFMRFLLFFCIALLIFSCKIEKPKNTKPSFLIGNWIQVNRMDHLVTYENWQENFTGLGYTLNKKDTTFKEMMRIISLNDSLYLEVRGVNEKPTLFKFTSQTDSSFTCENKKNEFPKKIKYYFEYNYLKAEVSNDDYNIDFVFEKL